MGRSTLFTQEERAVLKLTEEITEIAKKGVTDETYQQVKEYYTDKEIAQNHYCHKSYEFFE